MFRVRLHVTSPLLLHSRKFQRRQPDPVSELCDALSFGLEWALGDPLVPLERLAKLFDPQLVFVCVLPLYERHAVCGLFDDEPFVPFHLEPHLTVKRDPGTSTRLLGQHNADLCTLR